MEVEVDLFNKLVSAGAIDSKQAQNLTDYQPENMTDSIVLDRDTAFEFENGLVASRYLEAVIGSMDKEKIKEYGVDLANLKQMKKNNNSSAKLFNWNIIFKEAEKLGIETDSDFKGLIIAGDPVMIVDLIKRISDFQEEKGFTSPEGDKQNKKGLTKKKVKEGVDILSMDPNRKPNKCESSLEIILNTLCRNFKMKPKQCAALLTNNNQYLMHSVVKGLKGNFEPVIGWYEELNSVSDYFAEIVCLESKKHKKHNTLIMAMNAIKTGCFSQNYEVAQWCLRFITKLAYEFEGSICQEPLSEWVSYAFDIFRLVSSIRSSNLFKFII